MYISAELSECSRLNQVIELINSGVCEGFEGIEFTSSELAGQYAYDAASDVLETVTGNDISVHLEILEDGGAKFDFHEALSHGILFSKFMQENKGD
jgi:hypothetical protein